MSHWSKDLACEWLSWEVGKSDSKTLILRLAQGHCCDMSGAIRTAQALMPEVEIIATFSGGSPDTTYVLTEKGWRASQNR